MKKYTAFLIILIAMTLRLSAQIPNGGFENWETVPTVYAPYTGGSCENPTGWVSSNSYSAGSFFAITKSTDHYPDSVGSYSIRIENDTTLSNNATLLGGVPVQSYSGRGFVSTGTPPPSPNFAISGHPTSVTGYYKYAPLNGDVMLIYITLFNNGTAVTTGELELGAAAASSSWTSFTIPLSYAVADSASILLAAYRSASTSDLPLGNSVLYVDNIDFGAFITPSTNAVTLDTSAHIAVISNTTWTAVSDQSWLLASPATATKGNDTISLKATANPTITARTATVTVSAMGVTSQTITVTQAAGDTTLTVSAKTASVAKDTNSTTTVTVSSNTKWTATSNETWLTVSPDTATQDTATLTFTATANPNSTARTATVTVSAMGVTSQTITVTQAAGDTTLTVSAKTASVAKDTNSTTTVTVSSNTKWTATSNETWLTVSPDTATQDTATLTFTATANPNSTTRTATVTVSAKGVTSQTITVTQAAGDTTLTVSAKTASVAKDTNSTTTVTVSSNTKWTATSNETWLTVSPDTATQDTATLTFTATANPNSTTRTATVTVSAKGATSQTITVTQAAGTGTGFATVDEADVILYPNPATSKFSINTQSLTKVQIYTVSGTLVLSKQVNGKESIPTNNLTKGMYVVKIITDNAVSTKTLIVE